jgi:hypothetical protein
MQIVGRTQEVDAGMAHLAGYSQNELPVYVDLCRSEAAKHISRDPHLMTWATEVLSRTNLDKTVVNLEYDMGHNVGFDYVVKTGPTDVIFYVQQVKDKVYTRFIKNGLPLATNYISMRLEQSDNDGLYWLSDIWIGRLTPPVPGSSNENSKSRTYWEDHALVFVNQPIQSRTLTKTCPY